MFWNHNIEVTRVFSVDDVEGKWVEGNKFLGVFGTVDVNTIG